MLETIINKGIDTHTEDRGIDQSNTHTHTHTAPRFNPPSPPPPPPMACASAPLSVKSCVKPKATGCLYCPSRSVVFGVVDEGGVR